MSFVERPDYLLTVANRYLALKGAAMVTSLDIALILDWEMGGIPLGAALAGIDRAFRALAPGKPRNLGTCLPFVTKSIPEFAPNAGNANSTPPAPYDPEAEITHREELWEQSPDDAKNRAMAMARAVLQNDLAGMEKTIAEETVLNIAKRILASREE